MRTCPYCKTEVGGTHKKCPVCQSHLSGQPDGPYFPKPTVLKITSFLYRLQLFIVFTIIISALGAQYLFFFNPFDKCPWSLLVTMWLLAFEFGIIRLFKKGANSSRVLTIFVFIVTILLMITAYFTGYFKIMTQLIVPIIIIGTMIANFVLAMVDQIADAMVYLLTNVAVGIIPYIVLFFKEGVVPFAWIVCLMVSIILFVGAVIFKGRPVLSEIQRRFNV